MSRTLYRRPSTGLTALALTSALILPPAALTATASATTTGATAMTTLAPASSTSTPELIRIDGQDRTEVAAAVSDRWSPGLDVVYVANGWRYPDVTTAAARAGRDAAPVLLAGKSWLAPATGKALERLKPNRIVVVGNTADISDDLVRQLRPYATSGTVSRLAGSDAYATAAAVAKGYPSGLGRVYLASGTDFPDALSGSTAAGHHGVPILYTAKSSLPSSTADALSRLKPKEVVVLGGTNSIQDSVARDAARHAGLSTWRRLGGADRYATAALVSGEMPDRGALYAASGESYGDPAVGSALAAMRGGPLLLVKPDAVPAATAEVVATRAPRWVTVFGGTDAVSEATAQELVGSQSAPEPEPPADDLPGWSLQYSTDFSSLDGWVARDETQSNDNSRNIPENVVPGTNGLTIHARRESGYNRPYTSGEIHGASDALKVPNYFRAEVTGEVMDEKGLWPAALWFRPVGHPDGEIDVMEYMGGNSWNEKRKRFAVTMHNEYGSTQASLKDPIYIDELTKNTVTGVHTYTIEKTPGQIKVWIDGEEHLASVFKASDAEWWNRIMEVDGRQWYPRITLQVGSGQKVVVPEPEDDWTHSEMTIHSLKIWAMD